MSRTRRIISGTGIAYAHQAAIAVVGLWLTPFLLRHVGQRTLGLWLLTGQVLGYLALMDLGVIAILPREVAMAGSGEDAAARVQHLIARVRKIVGWQTGALALISAVVWVLMPDSWADLRWPFAIVLVSFVALYPARVSVAALQGAQDLSFLSTTQFVGWLVSTVVTIALILAGWTLYALVIGWTLSVAIPLLAARYRAAKRWRRPAIVEPAPVREYMSQSLWVSVSQVAQVLTNGSDVLLLGRILGAAAVVPYACTGKLVTVFANHPSLLMHAAQPALSELRTSASRERLASVATALAQTMLILSGALVVFILPFNHFFVSWWIGPSQYGGALLTIAFAAMMFVRHWNVSAVYTLFCFGYERQISLTGLGDGMLSAALTSVFVWKWGLVGAPAASIVGALLISLPINLRSIAREMGTSVGAFVMSLVPLFARVLAVGATAMLASMAVPHASLLHMALLLSVTGAVYCIVVLPLALAGPLGPYLRSYIPVLRHWDRGARAMADRDPLRERLAHD